MSQVNTFAPTSISQYNVYNCEICQQKIETQKKFVEHSLKAHGIPKPFQCTKCDYKTNVMCALKRHMGKHLEPRSYECTHCPETFSVRNNFLFHMREHNGKLNPKCDVCNTEFSTKQQLNHHIIKHTNHSKFMCEICKYPATRKETLESHYRSKHTHPNEKHFSCLLCPKKFFSKEGLKYHELSHDPDKVLHCDKCKYTTTSNATLANHIELTHNKVRKFGCTTCCKSFRCASGLQRHLLIHINEKPFTCDVCDLLFRCNFALKNHQQEAHSGEKTYTCEYCEKMFHLISTFRPHVRLHNAKLHVCNFWGKTYKVERLLICHMENHTREKPFSCSICFMEFRSSET